MFNNREIRDLKIDVDYIEKIIKGIQIKQIKQIEYTFKTGRKYLHN